MYLNTGYSTHDRPHSRNPKIQNRAQRQRNTYARKSYRTYQKTTHRKPTTTSKPNIITQQPRQLQISNMKILVEKTLFTKTYADDLKLTLLRNMIEIKTTIFGILILHQIHSIDDHPEIYLKLRLLHP